MTENGTWTEEHVLASDVWGGEKSLTPMTLEEELAAWRKTVGMLDNLCGMADALMLDPLILALGDALGRSREELARVADRLSRPEVAQLGPRERERLQGLLRRSDALNVALDAYERNPDEYPAQREEYLRVLREVNREAHEQFMRYRGEVGIPAPATRRREREEAAPPA